MTAKKAEKVKEKKVAKKKGNPKAKTTKIIAKKDTKAKVASKPKAKVVGKKKATIAKAKSVSKPKAELKKAVESKVKQISKEACGDKNCPYCGRLRTHGRVFEGVVMSDKMQGTVTVQWPRQRYVPKYERYYKTRSKVKAHNPPCVAAKTGDKVRIAECRPISKTVSFVIVEVLA